MKIAVVGSRTYTDRWQMGTVLAPLIAEYGEQTIIVSGGAKGADRMAEHFALAFGLRTIIYRADWAGHGKRAGFIRNRLIVDECDLLLAFYGPEGNSKGTANSVSLARSAGKEVRIYHDRSQGIIR